MVSYVSDHSYLSSLCALSEHDYSHQLVLPDHPPEVTDGIGHGTLGCNVGIWVVVALGKKDTTFAHYYMEINLV